MMFGPLSHWPLVCFFVFAHRRRLFGEHIRPHVLLIFRNISVSFVETVTVKLGSRLVADLNYYLNPIFKNEGKLN
jgi:hypothetical protein